MNIIETQWVERLTQIARERFNLEIGYTIFFQEKKGWLHLQWKQRFFYFLTLAHRSIQLSPDLNLPENHSIAAVVIAHEIAHYYDCQRNYRGDLKRYMKEYKERCLYVEKKTWLYATLFLEEVGFTEWSSFMEFACRGYGSYVEQDLVFDVFKEKAMERFKKGLAYLIGEEYVYEAI